MCQSQNIPKEIIIYSDESDRRGAYYSNFFGGALVLSNDIKDVIKTLQEAKNKENLFQELKWTKVTENYLRKYQNIIKIFFELIRQKKSFNTNRGDSCQCRS